MKAAALVFLLMLVCVLPADGACPAVAFEPRINHSISGGTNPLIGSVADVNGDGREDVSFFFTFSGRFRTYLARPDGTLTPRPIFFTGGSSSALEIADIDGNDLPDAAAGSGFAVRLYAGDGTGSFVPRAEIALPAAPTDIRVADLNEDGLNDVLVVMALESKTVLLTRTGPWTFSVGPQIDLGGEPREPHVVDLEADGNLDVVMINALSSIDILYGRGDGTFDPVVKIELIGGLSSSGASLAVGDFNYDGRPDLAAGQIQNGAALYVNDGGRIFHFDRRVAGEGAVTPGAGARSMELGDLNADGLADLIISTYGGFYTVLALPSGFFDTPVFWQVPELSMGPLSTWLDRFKFEAGDTRGDGRIDLVATISDGPVVTYPSACVPPPVLTSLSPGSGPPTGGTTVTITGESLLTTSQVLFGSTPATILDRTGTAVTVRTPASPPSIVDVTVTTGGGTATLEDGFQFLILPELALHVSRRPEPGQPFRVTAVLSPPVNGGTITFTVDGVVVGTAPVTNGTAFIDLVVDDPGSHEMEAAFSGFGDFAPQNAVIVFQVSHAIPTLSEWALLALAVMLAAIAVRAH